VLSPNKPIIVEPSFAPRTDLRADGFGGRQIAAFFVAFTVLISIPIWTHPLPPLSDYVNHLARMHVIASLPNDSQLAGFYEVHWQVIPNLIMDLIVPLLARIMNIYVAGQVYTVAMFALIVSGTLALNRALIGRWSAFPLLAIPLLYNYVFLVGLMNYLFGIGVALWALAGWIAIRERAWPSRFALSAACAVVLFVCHLSALGVYGVGVLSFELWRLWEQRREPWLRRVADFVASGLPFLVAAPLLYASPTMQLGTGVSWDWGKADGLMYVFSNYSEIAAFVLIAVMLASIAWAVQRRMLRFHPLVYVLLAIGGAVYLALPRIMLDTYMIDQRVPIGVAFMLFACGDLVLHRRLVRHGFLVLVTVLIAGRLIEIDRNWALLSQSGSEFRASVHSIAPGSKVFVAYADEALGEDVHDLGLVHAACIAMIERSALVTTAFTVAGKQVMHVRPEYRDYVDTQDGTPPSMAQLIGAAEDPRPDTPKFWSNWTKFDYLYVLFTEEETPNPDAARLELVAAGERFQLYRILKSEIAVSSRVP